jgi:WD40 repeat protein
MESRTIDGATPYVMGQPHSGDYITSVAGLSDGNFVTGSQHGKIRLWNTQTGEVLKQFVGSDNTTFVTGLPDGNFVSVYEAYNFLTLWNTKTGEKIRDSGRPIKHPGRTRCIATLPNGNCISGVDNNIQLHDTTTCKFIRMFSGHTEPVTCLASLPNGNFVSGSSDRTLRVWNTETGEMIRQIDAPREIKYLTGLPDGKFVSGSENEIVDGVAASDLCLWNSDTGEMIRSFDKDNMTINCLATLPSGHFVSGSVYGVRVIWNAKTGEMLKMLYPEKGFQPQVYLMHIAVAKGNIISVFSNDEINIWNPLPRETGRKVRNLQQAMGKGERGRTFYSPNFGINANESSSILHRMPLNTRNIVGSFLGHPENRRTNPERAANRAAGKSNYNKMMNKLQDPANPTVGGKTKKRKNSRRRRNAGIRKETRKETRKGLFGIFE